MVSREQVESSHRSQEYEFALGDELRGERATKGKTLLDVQRDLRIQASYISAIEDGEVAAFPNPSFIPGYIRSYARYLGLDPDEVFRRFCAEHGFDLQARRTAARPQPERRVPGQRPASPRDLPLHAFQPRFPLVEPKASLFANVEASAIGSLLVLVALVAALGYGGWTVLQNIQRVQFAPVEDLPIAVAEVAPLEAPLAGGNAEPALADLAKPVTATALTDLYRQQELEVPILSPRDGPIAAIDPEHAAPLKERMVQEIVRQAVEQAAAEGPSAALTEAAFPGDEPTPPVGEPAPVQLTVLVERAAWIRVYLENGTVIFERILEKGESYTPPEGVGVPLIWAGNSGSVYVRLGEELHGPLGPGTRAIRDIPLDPVSIAETYERVAEIPEVISQTIGVVPPAPEPVAIQ
jgi:cytoskeleton protein RodZ